MRILTALLLVANLGFADTITFRDGRRVNGTFLGADTRTVRVAVGDRVENYAMADVTNISFDAPPVAAAPAPPPPPPPARESAPMLRQAPAETPSMRRVDARVIPNGTVLTIRLIDDVDSRTDDVGKTYRASLDEPVNDANGNLLVARGADVTVKLVDDKESGKIEGKTVLTLDKIGRAHV